MIGGGSPIPEGGGKKAEGAIEMAGRRESIWEGDGRETVLQPT